MNGSSSKLYLWHAVISTASHHPVAAAGRSPAGLLVFDPVRDGRIRLQPPHLVLLVVLEVALEPFDVAVALEGEDVGGEIGRASCREGRKRTVARGRRRYRQSMAAEDGMGRLDCQL